MEKRIRSVMRTLLAGIFLGACPGLAVEPGTGTITFTHPETNRRVVLFYVKAETVAPETPPVVVLHGMNRNPWDYRDAWIGLAEAHGLFVVVPYFSEADYPGVVGYNLGNVFHSETNLERRPESSWSYRIPDLVFDHLKQRGATTAAGYFAFGHSAGSQFLHRKIGFAPDPRMLLAVAANAGWYTLPDPGEPWPYGYGGTGLAARDMPPILAANLVILLGDQDTDTGDSGLRKAPEAMRQGKHRVERGYHFHEFGKQLAARLGVPFNWRIAEVPGVGHDYAGMAPAGARMIAEYCAAHAASGED
jgi:poly(3-hydroxybutyrate) depolymerase